MAEAARVGTQRCKRPRPETLFGARRWRAALHAQTPVPGARAGQAPRERASVRRKGAYALNGARESRAGM